MQEEGEKKDHFILPFQPKPIWIHSHWPNSTLLTGHLFSLMRAHSLHKFKSNIHYTQCDSWHRSCSATTSILHISIYYTISPILFYSILQMFKILWHIHHVLKMEIFCVKAHTLFSQDANIWNKLSTYCTKIDYENRYRLSK